MLSKLTNFVVAAQALSYDYATNGADWIGVSADCGLTNQSPINLVSYGSDNFEYKTYKSKDDMI
jgi:hypothetical protein